MNKLNDMIRSLLLLSIICFLCRGNLSAQTLPSKLDSVISKEFANPNEPGGVFMVSRNGKPIYLKAVGKANIELGVDLSIESVFQIGSMTKQFTAIAILLLEQEGKLTIQDPIAKYLPDYPNGEKITLHHLLTHTSGIKDFTKMKALKDIAQKEMSPRMMVDFFKNEPADFPPGEKFDYNNSGYVVLGYLIELLSGQSYESFIEENIFRKIGMTNSFYASDRKIILKRAYGYQLKESGLVNKTIVNFSVPYSSGALMSTLDDLLKWQNALRDHSILRKEFASKAFQAYKLNNGEIHGYGYGWHIRTTNGINIREHGGSIFGFKSMAIYIPEEDIYIVGLTNCDCKSPTQLIKSIAELIIESFHKK